MLHVATRMSNKYMNHQLIHERQRVPALSCIVTMTVGCGLEKKEGSLGTGVHAICMKVEVRSAC